MRNRAAHSFCGAASPHHYLTAGGVGVSVREKPAGEDDAVRLLRSLDQRRGAFLSCGVTAPGRYSPFALGFVDPPLSITVRGGIFRIEALNVRGKVLLPAMGAVCARFDPTRMDGAVEMAVPVVPFDGPEEERTRRPSIFSVLRLLRDMFASANDGLLGFYGAFGYDLAFALEDIRRRHERQPNQRDLVLYLPDRIVLSVHGDGHFIERSYDFAIDGQTTEGLSRTGSKWSGSSAIILPTQSDAPSGGYAAAVEQAREMFKRGDLFEVVLSQSFRQPCSLAPSEVFDRLRSANPAPYEALLSLGEGEHLVAASPEMFVRTSGRRVETCPISGTIARGTDALADADAIRALLSSRKDEAELTMCTDVDRNDKARVCEPGSVRVIGRRMIEMYSRLIHTVDHVEGRLREDMDALDAFLTHTWAVTVTGAPKRRAMQAVEDMEAGPRGWYGGAFGALRFDGSLDTGLTLRTLRLCSGVAEVRAGATLLYDSDALAEDAECRLKASALLTAATNEAQPDRTVATAVSTSGQGRRILLVDHEDSFVLTLADYLRRTGAQVTTLRPAAARDAIERGGLDLVVLSPGPGRPEDFSTADILDRAERRGLPVFGVCLGLQAIVEFCGGELEVLTVPVHGKPSAVLHNGEGVFRGLPSPFIGGRYHSISARRDNLPEALRAIAETADGVVMAVEHRTRPWIAVQFHPESIMTAADGAGMRLLDMVVEALCGRRLADREVCCGGEA